MYNYICYDVADVLAYCFECAYSKWR